MGVIEIISLIISALAVAGSVTSTVLANKTNKTINEETREDQQQFARENAVTANKETRELYSGLYSPAAKAKQLREAGLSVGLMYGQGGAGGTSSTSGVQAVSPSVAAPVINPAFGQTNLSELLQALKTPSEIEQNESQTNLNEKLEEKAESEIEVNEKKVDEILANIRKTNAEADTEQVRKELVSYQTAIEEFKSKLNEETYEEQKETIIDSWKLLRSKLKEQLNLTEISRINKEWAEEIKEAEYNVLKATVVKLWAERGELMTRAALNTQKTAESKQAVRKMQAEINQKIFELMHQDNWNASKGSGLIGGLVGEIFAIGEWAWGTKNTDENSIKWLQGETIE